jgi:hypothetical protein
MLPSPAVLAPRKHTLPFRGVVISPPCAAISVAYELIVEPSQRASQTECFYQADNYPLSLCT